MIGAHTHAVLQDNHSSNAGEGDKKCTHGQSVFIDTVTVEQLSHGLMLSLSESLCCFRNLFGKPFSIAC